MFSFWRTGAQAAITLINENDLGGGGRGVIFIATSMPGLESEYLLVYMIFKCFLDLKMKGCVILKIIQRADIYMYHLLNIYSPIPAYTMVRCAFAVCMYCMIHIYREG